MPSKQNESRIHHFVPRSVLRRFAVGPEGNSVAVFDKATGRAWEGGLTATGSCKGYNTLRLPDGHRLNFESDFDAIDRDYAGVGRVLARRRSLHGLGDAFMAMLADVAAVQFLRTPIVRSSLEEIPRRLLGEMRAFGIDVADGDVPDDDAVRQSVRRLIADRDRLRRALVAKDIILLEPAGAARLWTSDHPVARHSRMPLGETGFECLGVEIYLPLAADLIVGFLCPSFRSAANAIIDGGVRESVSTAEVLRRGTPLRVADEVIGYLNALQFFSSQRFIYASHDGFDLARKMRRLQPDSSVNQSMFHLGRLGEAPPRPANIPPGEWLYLETGTHCLMIPVFDYDGRGAHAEMSTRDTGRLARAATVPSFTRAAVFADSGSLEKRGVRIELVASGATTRFRLVHSDPALRMLETAIARDIRRP